jgi:hypothetical protein
MFHCDRNETEPCPKSYIVIERKQLKFSWLQKNRDSITQTIPLVKIGGQTFLENFCEFCKMSEKFHKLASFSTD